ncbi:hypothetical protein D3C87_266390 [compost metagenome]
MKKALLILFVAVASLTACKKDKSDTEKLEGRWNLTKEYSVYTVNGAKVDEDTETYAVGEFYIVFDGNNYQVFEDGDLDDSGTFTISDNVITINSKDGGSDTNNIRWNSNNEFVLVDEETGNNGGQSYSYRDESTFQKH